MKKFLETSVQNCLNREMGLLVQLCPVTDFNWHYTKCSYHRLWMTRINQELGLGQHKGINSIRFTHVLPLSWPHSVSHVYEFIYPKGDKRHWNRKQRSEDAKYHLFAKGGWNAWEDWLMAWQSNHRVYVVTSAIWFQDYLVWKGSLLKITSTCLQTIF